MGSVHMNLFLLFTNGDLRTLKECSVKSTLPTVTHARCIPTYMSSKCLFHVVLVIPMSLNGCVYIANLTEGYLCT